MVIEGGGFPAQRGADVGHVVIVGVTDLVEVLQRQIGNLHQVGPASDLANRAHLARHVHTDRTSLELRLADPVDWDRGLVVGVHGTCLGAASGHGQARAG